MSKKPSLHRRQDTAQTRAPAHHGRRGDLDLRGDTKTAINVLNDALATEIVCVLRYKRHNFMAKGIPTPAPSPPNFWNMPTMNSATPT
jgi:bacterioferritin